MQRQEPGDPRAKAIEAMARALYMRNRQVYEPSWGQADAAAREHYLADAKAALAALEAEGWGLTNKTYPYREGDAIVLGPEVIATPDEAVINWKGENYMPPMTVLDDNTREVERLREAVRAELTHGGIRDRIAQETAVLGAESEQGSPVRRAAERLDRDRDAFYERMTEALSSVPVEDGSNGCDLLPRWGEFHDSPGGPLYAVHDNGLIYAIFAGPQQALEYQRGLDGIARRYFHIENAAGERLTLTEHRPRHAHAILDTLNRKAVEGDSTNG